MASIGDDWDDKNADAVSGTYVNALGIVGMIFGLKTSLKPSVKPSPVPTGVANTVATSERISSPLWTATKSDSAAANALRHFNDHGADFPGVNNSLEYVADAQSFLRSPPSGTLTRVRTNGDVVRYNPGSNTFGVMDSTGAPRTYFRPDPADHGLPTNLDYFNAQ
jgi:pyocin large subunit-like protein